MWTKSEGRPGPGDRWSRPSFSEPFYPPSRGQWLLSHPGSPPEGLPMHLEHLLMPWQAVREECLEGDLWKSSGGGSGR